MFFRSFIYFERDRNGASGLRVEREADRKSQAGSSLSAPMRGLSSQNHELMTWDQPRVRRLTDWATQVTLLTNFYQRISTLMRETKTVRKVDVFSNKERIFRLGKRRHMRKMTTFLKSLLLLYANEFSDSIWSIWYIWFFWGWDHSLHR